MIAARSTLRCLPRAILALVFALLLLTAGRASAHVTPGGFTLHQLCRAADIVAVGRVTRVASEVSKGLPALSAEAEVVEFLRQGESQKSKIEFAPHRHGDENYQVGEEILLFLVKKQNNKDGGSVVFESIDSITERFVLKAESRSAWIEATRGFVALGKGPQNSTDPVAFGRLTVLMLNSNEPGLAALSLRDLTLAGSAPLVGTADVPGLLSLCESKNRSISFRTGLLVELERRKLVEVGPNWVKLLRDAAPDERIFVIQSAASRAFVPAVTAELLVLLEDQKPEIAIAAGRALGTAGNVAAVPGLSRAVLGEPQEKRFVALGSLRRIGTKEAAEVLARVAASHKDPETKKVAITEQNLLGPLKSSPSAEPSAEPKSNTPWIVAAAAVLAFFAALAFRKRITK